MENTKTKRMCMDIQEIVDGMTKEDLGKPSIVEYYKNLVKLKYYLCKCQDDEERKEFSQRMGRSYAYDAYRDGPEWGAYADGSMRGRDAMGRYTSGDYRSMSYCDPGEQLRTLMQNPDMPRETKEYLRKAIEAMR